MEKLLLSSARRPEKIWLVRKTSRWTSFAIASTVPGFFKPSASLRAWKELYVSKMVSTKLFVRIGEETDVATGGVTSTSTGTATFSKGGAAAILYVCALRSKYGQWRREIKY